MLNENVFRSYQAVVLNLEFEYVIGIQNSIITLHTMKKNNIKKPLCKIEKSDIEEHFNELAAIVAEPKYLCCKCARVATKKSYLCKPVNITPATKKEK